MIKGKKISQFKILKYLQFLLVILITSTLFLSIFIVTSSARPSGNGSGPYGFEKPDTPKPEIPGEVPIVEAPLGFEKPENLKGEPESDIPGVYENTELMPPWLYNEIFGLSEEESLAVQANLEDLKENGNQYAINGVRVDINGNPLKDGVPEEEIKELEEIALTDEEAWKSGDTLIPTELSETEKTELSQEEIDVLSGFKMNPEEEEEEVDGGDETEEPSDDVVLKDDDEDNEDEKEDEKEDEEEDGAELTEEKVKNWDLSVFE